MKIKLRISVLSVVMFLPMVLFSQAAATQNYIFPGSVNPIPFISQPLVPDCAMPGGPNFMLTINGSGFVAGSIINWNGSPRTTTFVSASQLRAAITASDIANVGTAWITVVNPAPGGGTSGTAFFPVSLPSPTAVLALRRSDVVPAGGLANTAEDLNGDGNLDLMANSLGGDTMRVWLGNGDGTFQPVSEYYVGRDPYGSASADFNGDGKLDLAVALHGEPALSILLGNGDGSYQYPIKSAAGSGPLDMALGDFNKDGKMDAAVTASDNRVGILLGNGDGTFQPRVAYEAGDFPINAATGDFNGDSNLDIAVTNRGSGSVSILLGYGDGTFRPHVDYPAGSGAFPIITADLNADGELDLAVGHYWYDASIAVLIGNGDGTFRPPVIYQTGGGGPQRLVAVELNGDGRVDLATAQPHPDNNRISVLLGHGDGTFHPHMDYVVGTLPGLIVAGDFNKDGKLDVVASGVIAMYVMLQPVLWPF